MAALLKKRRFFYACEGHKNTPKQALLRDYCRQERLTASG